MARVPERNPRYRTKEQICGDLATLLNAPITWGTQFAAIGEALWVWSEFDGKYSGCKYWSKNAWSLKSDRKELRHDHAVPKKVVLERLEALRGDATSAKVRKVFDAWCIGVVITRDEDATLTRCGLRSRMPDNWDEKDQWSRYRAAKIAIRWAHGSRRK